MTITIKYFASLRETLGKAEEVLDTVQTQRVQDVWVQVNSGDQQLPEGVLCAVNYVHATAKTEVYDGDEVAFFPPVTGG